MITRGRTPRSFSISRGARGFERATQGKGPTKGWLPIGGVTTKRKGVEKSVVEPDPRSRDNRKGLKNLVFGDFGLRERGETVDE